MKERLDSAVPPRGGVLLLLVVLGRMGLGCMPIQRFLTLKRLIIALSTALTIIGVSIFHEGIGRALEMSIPAAPASSPMADLARIPLQKPSLGQSLPPGETSLPKAEQAAPASSAPPQAETAGAQETRIAVNTRASEADSGAIAAHSIGPMDSTQVAALNEWQGASFPVENFQTYTSPFGYRRSPTGGYSQEFHYGLDMAAPEGSYIRNWWSGTVVEVSDDSNCGTSVVVESGPWLHIYCHMSGYVDSDAQGRYMIDRNGGLKIYEGQVVAAGDRIGRVGMTGRTTGPHLHWGLKYDNNWVDPAFVLRAMYYSQQATAQSIQ
jgi:murein DD-endopeptidase MepM/ murein hydrolase activator NlpD